MNICLFSNDEISKTLPRNDERAQHIIKVLHKKAGDTFTAGIIGGASGTARIVSIDEQGIYFDFTASGITSAIFIAFMLSLFFKPRD